MSSFFSVVAKPKTWTTAVYMLLGLPLGIAYFTFLVTGVSLGTGLMPLALVGIPILMLVAIGTRAMMRFERELAVGLLGADMDEVPLMPPATGNWIAKLKALFSDRTTWSGIVYLLARFPLGIATFTVAVTTLAVSGATATLWIFYRWVDWEVGNWQVDTASEALMFLVPGVFLFFVSLHLLNWLGSVSVTFEKAMIARSQ